MPPCPKPLPPRPFLSSPHPPTAIFGTDRPYPTENPRDAALSKSPLLPLPQAQLQHPLPARPLPEMCLTKNVQPCTPASSGCQAREGSVPSACLANVNHPSDLTGHPQKSCAPLSPNIVPDFLIDSGTVGTLEEDSYRTTVEESTIPIDPLILDDEGPSEATEQRPTVDQTGNCSLDGQGTTYPFPEPLVVIQNHPDRHLESVECPAFREAKVYSYDRAHSCERSQEVRPTRQSCQPDVPSCDGRAQSPHNGRPSHSRARKRKCGRTLRPDRRPTKRLRATAVVYEKEGSFSTLSSHFSASPVAERLQFLSWLFEGALPRCMSDLKRTADIAPPTVEKEGGGLRSSRRLTRSRERVPAIDNSDMRRLSSRKGMPWLPEEEDLLVKLRREQGLPWSVVARLFSEQYSGRSQGSIQVY